MTILTPPAWSLPDNQPIEVTPGIRKRIRKIASQIKDNSAYTKADGERLGIIGTQSEDVPDASTKAAFTAHASANYTVSVEFKKQGADAMQFEMRKTGETNWNVSSIKSSSPAKLTFSFNAPTQIELRAILVKKDDPIGEYSDIVIATAAP